MAYVESDTNERLWFCDRFNCCHYIIATQRAAIRLYWFIGRKASDLESVIVRCPFHVSERTLRDSEVGRSVKVRRFYAFGLKQALRNPSKYVSVSNTPYPMFWETRTIDPATITFLKKLLKGDPPELEGV